jgi:hypothetical protein
MKSLLLSQASNTHTTPFFSFLRYTLIGGGLGEKGEQHKTIKKTQTL